MTPKKVTLLRIRTAAWARFLQHRLAANVLAKKYSVPASNARRGAILDKTPTRPCKGDLDPAYDDWAIDRAPSHLGSYGVHAQILLDARFQVLE